MSFGWLHYCCPSCGHAWKVPTRNIEYGDAEYCPREGCEENFLTIYPYDSTVDATMSLSENGDLLARDGEVLIPDTPHMTAQVIFGAVVATDHGPVQLETHQGLVIQDGGLPKGTIVEVNDHGEVEPATELSSILQKLQEDIKASVSQQFDTDTTPVRQQVQDIAEANISKLYGQGSVYTPVHTFAVSDHRNNSPEDIENQLLIVDVWTFNPPPHREPGSYLSLHFHRDLQAGRMPRYIVSTDIRLTYVVFQSTQFAEKGIGIVLTAKPSGFTGKVFASTGIEEWAKRFPNNIGAPEYWEHLENKQLWGLPAHYKPEVDKCVAWSINELMRIFKGSYKRWPKVEVITNEDCIQIEVE